jgi:hypothetical protein
MASFRGHLALAAPLAAGYGIAAAVYLPPPLSWGVVLLGAGLTVLGGLLPDLDSDSGVPVREMFSLLAVAVPVLLFQHLQQRGIATENILVLLAAAYLLIRFWVSGLFKKYTVHRGMFHSLPGMVIAGLSVFLIVRTSNPNPHQQFIERLYLAGGVMIGFASHLILDEIFAVDFEGVKITLNKYAGSAFKLWSKSRPATLTAYFILAVLALLAWQDVTASTSPP